MLFEDVEELEIINGIMKINGYGVDTPLPLEEHVKAVFYKKADGIMNEEIDGSFVPCNVSKYQEFIDAWEIAMNPVPLPLTEEEKVLHIKNYATNSIDMAIYNELNTYNEANGTAFETVHNAESYSRIPTYTHQAFCEAVWLWSVELWEFMRTWQGTLTALPTEEDIINKIAEKPFVFVS